MYKNSYVKTIVFLIFFICVTSLIISASSAETFEPTKKIDSGKKIIKVKNEKYQIKWETEQELNNDEEHTHIKYKSLKNKKNHGQIYLTLDKISKNKMVIYKYSTSMRLGSDRKVKIKTNTSNYYWKKLRPNIINITKNSILNKEILKYNKTRYFNRTITDPANNKTIIKSCKMNWKMYYYVKTSSIEIEERVTDLSYNGTNKFGEWYYFYGFNNDIRIDKYTKGKLRITISPVDMLVLPCQTVSNTYKYVKTNLTPKQYFLKIYKKKIETKKLT